jgi:DNA-binding PadR family transcriptional regulator
VPPPQSLNYTAVVVLAMVASGHSNGWQISQAVDRSTRFFWSASRGGVYPELRKLESAGLLKATDDPKGEVVRHNYSVTVAGRAALREWLTSTTPGAFELRSEDLLRLFFSADLTDDEQLAILRNIRAGHQSQLDELNQISRPSAEKVGAPIQLVVLDYGISLHTSAVNWCLETERRLTAHPLP